jgi:hypothetical protein
VVNSVLSATHTAEMDAGDQKDIIKKVKSSGEGEGDIDVNVDVNTGDEDEDVDINTDDEDLGLGDEEVEETSSPLVRLNKKIGGNFKLGEGKTPHVLESPRKKPIFVNINDKIVNELRELAMSDVKESPAQPTVVPDIKPNIKPSRRQKPWKIKPNVSPNPKASEGDSLMKEDGEDAGDGKIVSTRYLTNKEAILRVKLNGEEVDIKFKNSEESGDKPASNDKPLIYQYNSTDSPDGKLYTIGVEFYGTPETRLELGDVQDDYINVG